MKPENECLQDEFQLFLSAAEVAPPKGATAVILGHVRENLNPSLQSVFMKILGIHAVVSLASLSLCSQFGFRTLPLFDLMDQFMHVVGPNYCMAFCGAIYLGLSALAFSLILRPEQIAVIRRHAVLEITLLAGISLGIFLCLGASLLFVPVALWILGALAGGIGSLELGWQVRSYFRRKLIYGV